MVVQPKYYEYVEIYSKSTTRSRKFSYFIRDGYIVIVDKVLRKMGESF